VESNVSCKDCAVTCKGCASPLVLGRQLGERDTHILDLAKEAEPPADGILSRTIFQDDKIKAVVFGFGQGQELSEHTAAKPAMLFFVKGEATVGLGGDVQEAQGGTWVHMPANLKHSIKARTPVVMLLVLLK